MNLPSQIFLAASILGPAAWVALTGCSSGDAPMPSGPSGPSGPPVSADPPASDGPANTRGATQLSRARRLERERMVEEQIVARGVRDPRLLAALRRVPRELFVPAREAPDAYADHPLPIGFEQTISQPYIVAYMTEHLALAGDERVLEIGTGSGYQAAVLAELAREVYTIEIVPELARRARELLARLGYDQVHVRAADGYRGWPERAPFDRILLTAAPERVPEPLLEQLAIGGRLVAPIGGRGQELVLIERTPEGYTSRELLPVRFVPMTGEARGD